MLNTRPLMTAILCALPTITIGLSFAKTHTVSNSTATLQQTLVEAQNGDTVVVSGDGFGGNFIVPAGVSLLAAPPSSVVLDGKGRGPVVTLMHESSIKGFEIRNGTIGVLVSATGTAIQNNLIHSNTQSGIICIGHLPAIEDNRIVYNRGSGIQGWDVRSTSASINHNIVAYNDNHGLSVDGKSDIIFENNIVAFNGQYGVKNNVDTSSVTYTNNNFFRNGAVDELMPQNSSSHDPQFLDARSYDFKLRESSKDNGVRGVRW